ncbi:MULTISPECIES: type II toxin-antitoxin system RelE/ParE family toxin [Ensifer]|uniref:type II toxin-antitoxin system RelE/ParE family toxin n=1 Tax=Ensifer TaxID=106591 RepID=UPI001FEE8C8B|nr:type II toxin-antitoxin system RelE/ParE family toxin [Ensifer sp. ENS03]
MLPSALTDLVNILEYITRQSGSLMAGRRFVGELRQKCRTLADRHPRPSKAGIAPRYTQRGVQRIRHLFPVRRRTF